MAGMARRMCSSVVPSGTRGCDGIVGVIFWIGVWLAIVEALLVGRMDGDDSCDDSLLAEVWGGGSTLSEMGSLLIAGLEEGSCKRWLQAMLELLLVSLMSLYFEKAGGPTDLLKSFWHTDVEILMLFCGRSLAPGEEICESLSYYDVA